MDINSLEEIAKKLDDHQTLEMAGIIANLEKRIADLRIAIENAESANMKTMKDRAEFLKLELKLEQKRGN